ncbi:MAG: hypothetical protein AAGF53_16035 [Pseudomonadota bacterium]
MARRILAKIPFAGLRAGRLRFGFDLAGAAFRAVFLKPNIDFLAGFLTRFSATKRDGFRPDFDITNPPERTFFDTLHVALKKVDPNCSIHRSILIGLIFRQFNFFD